MKPGEILRAARLLKQREQLRRMHKQLKATPDMNLAMQSDSDDGENDITLVDNVTGQLTIEHAIWVITTELGRLKVEDD